MGQCTVAAISDQYARISGAARPLHGRDQPPAHQRPEIERHVAPHGELGAFLATRFKEMRGDHFGWSRVLWDVATVAWLLDPSWVPSELVPRPLLTDQCTWSVDRRRHPIRCASFDHRDGIFRDLFRKLAAAGRLLIRWAGAVARGLAVRRYLSPAWYNARGQPNVPRSRCASAGAGIEPLCLRACLSEHSSRWRT